MFWFESLIKAVFHFFSALERKISVRANREELVQKGILLPESPISPIPEPGNFLFFFHFVLKVLLDVAKLI